MYRNLPKILESLEVLDWKLANIIPIYKKGMREDPGRPVGTISEPGKVMGFLARKAEKMLDIKAWAEYIVEWAAKDPYGFLTTVILALTPLFVISAALSWKLAKMIEAREREQKKKQKRQENIAKAKRTKKD
ncbi:hypothetical protein HGM15179_013941 [Zosterops borbonicus]|uniref:Small integral membrane protein 15 n=1 Tax=Zosterops borbonicus TaxID=364589 RepID=A0A8K1G747_9PASS|nr:hypothetical protein HGM15179_013941 [Zosterops borbonicus]